MVKVTRIPLICQTYDKDGNLIEITEIPATTTIEAIIEKIVALVKAGKIREIQYVRDETDITGLKIAIDLKRGTDPDKLMQKLYKLTHTLKPWAAAS